MPQTCSKKFRIVNKTSDGTERASAFEAILASEHNFLQIATIEKLLTKVVIVKTVVFIFCFAYIVTMWHAILLAISKSFDKPTLLFNNVYAFRPRYLMHYPPNFFLQ